MSFLQIFARYQNQAADRFRNAVPVKAVAPGQPMTRPFFPSAPAPTITRPFFKDRPASLFTRPFFPDTKR